MRKIILIILFQSLILFNSLGQKTDLKIDSGFIEIGGGGLFFEMAGSGENIVLLHDSMAVMKSGITSFRYLQSITGW